MEYVVCTKCKRKLPATTEYFRKEPRKKNGLTSHCIDCRNRQRRKRYYKQLDKTKQYYQDNKLRYIASSLRQRGYKNIMESDLQLLINNFKNEHGVSICPYCGREIIEDDMMHFDHFYPRSKATKQQPLINLIPICRYCNRSKADEDFSYWYKNQLYYNSTREQELINYIKDGQIVPFYLVDKNSVD